MAAIQTICQSQLRAMDDVRHEGGMQKFATLCAEVCSVDKVAVSLIDTYDRYAAFANQVTFLYRKCWDLK